MRKRPDTSGIVPEPQEQKPVTSQLIEAYLACPTKCFLQSIGQASTGNAFATWNHTRSESYRLDGIKTLIGDDAHQCDLSTIEPGHWKTAPWPFALAQGISAQNLVGSLQIKDQHLVSRSQQDHRQSRRAFVRSVRADTRLEQALRRMRIPGPLQKESG